MSAAAPSRAVERRIVLGLAAGAVVLVVLIAVTISLSPPGVAPAALGISVSSAAGNWTLRVVAVSDPLLGIDDVFFLTRTPDGEPFSPLTRLSDLENTSNFDDVGPVGILSPGDAVVLPQSEYPAGLSYWFLESDRLLAVGTLA